MNFSLDLVVRGTYKGGSMTAAPKTSTLQAFCKKPMVVFAVLLLAGLQLSNATHQFDHSATDLADACSYCVQLDRLDDVNSVDYTLASLPSVSANVLDAALPRPVVRTFISSQPRAPPLS
ncbi:MAG: hypothetical protein ACR2QT_11445 [Woeseiaceae bacterium]